MITVHSSLPFIKIFDFSKSHVDLAMYHVDFAQQVMQTHLWKVEFVCNYPEIQLSECYKVYVRIQ